jgi:arginyl-tRNA synthetase
MKTVLSALHERLHALSGVALAPQDWAPTPDRTLGDFSIPCFKLSKQLGKAPPAAAQELAAKLAAEVGRGPLAGIDRVQAVGPYLNVFQKPEAIFARLEPRLAKGDARFGGSDAGVGKTVCVDFSSPNVAKEIGLHHLRSTAIGNALTRIFALHGYKVERINYLGDWGTSFGKLIEAFKAEGPAASVEQKLRAEGLSFMLDLYVRYNQAAKEKPALDDAAKAAFAKLEAGDTEYRRIWQLFRDVSIAEFKKLYARLGVDFDHYDGESLYEKRLDAAVDEVTAKVGTRLSDGALVADLPGHKVPVLLRKDDGASLYITRDIVAAEDRFARFNYDLSIYCVAVQQKLHFQQLFDLLKLMGKPFADRCEHVSFGMLSFGSKTMKSREGNMIFLKDALDEGKNKAAAIIREKSPDLANADEVAEMVGMGAIVFFDLSQNRNHDVKFDWDAALSFEGDTSPFIQYTHARCTSVVEKVIAAKGEATISNEAIAKISATEPVRNLLIDWDYFEVYAERALLNRDPSQVAAATLAVAKSYNQLYHKVRFLDVADPAERAVYVALTRATQRLLAHGLKLLGLRAPARM